MYKRAQRLKAVRRYVRLMTGTSRRKVIKPGFKSASTMPNKDPATSSPEINISCNSRCTKRMCPHYVSKLVHALSMPSRLASHLNLESFAHNNITRIMHSQGILSQPRTIHNQSLCLPIPTWLPRTRHRRPGTSGLNIKASRARESEVDKAVSLDGGGFGTISDPHQ